LQHSVGFRVDSVDDLAVADGGRVRGAATRYPTWKEAAAGHRRTMLRVRNSAKAKG
jgi:hypothetical protein